MPRARLPGLQVPEKVDNTQLKAFLEAVKERLEILTGERNSPLERAVTAADIKATGVVKVAVKSGYAELIGAGSEAGVAAESTTSLSGIDNALSLFTIDPEELGDDQIVIVWDKSLGAYRRLGWVEFAELFVPADDGYPPQLRHAGIP